MGSSAPHPSLLVFLTTIWAPKFCHGRATKRNGLRAAVWEHLSHPGFGIFVLHGERAGRSCGEGQGWACRIHGRIFHFLLLQFLGNICKALQALFPEGIRDSAGFSMGSADPLEAPSSLEATDFHGTACKGPSSLCCATAKGTFPLKAAPAQGFWGEEHPLKPQGLLLGCLEAQISDLP